MGLLHKGSQAVATGPEQSQVDDSSSCYCYHCPQGLLSIMRGKVGLGQGSNRNIQSPGQASYSQGYWSVLQV